LILAGALFAAYFFWWYHGLLTGSRYYFLLWFAAVWGTLSGLDRAAELLAGRIGGSISSARAACKRFVVASTALALLFYYPLLAFAYYPNFFGIDREPWDRISDEAAKPALIFVRGEGFSDFAVPFCLNAAPPGGDVVFARDLGPERCGQVSEAYPDRAVYIVEGLQLRSYECPLVHY
jgi:hypothetical protein